MIRILKQIFRTGIVTETLPPVNDPEIEKIGDQLGEIIRRRFQRSLTIRQVDAGSCNGCELEIHAMNNVFYNCERLGIHLAASPRFADLLLVTGPVSHNMQVALQRTPGHPVAEDRRRRWRLRLHGRGVRRELRLSWRSRQGHSGGRRHSRVPSRSYGPYLAGDGEYVNLAVASPADWDVFCRVVIEKPELLTDARFVTVQDRRKNRSSLEETIENIFASRDHKHWLAQLKKADLPHGIVRGIAQVLAHPQVAARKLIREADSPVGKVPVIANALKMSKSDARYDRIPGLGENNTEILSELGYDGAAIEALQRDKVIYFIRMRTFILGEPYYFRAVFIGTGN